jgi:dethiobiotin synthetase
MTQTVFVTGSGTGVGKTFVMCALIRALTAAGRSVRALKPVVSGFDRARLEGSDSGLLLAAQGLPLSVANLDAISPWRFQAALSPDMAAAREGREVPFDALVEFCRTPSSVDVTLIEGVGGVMVPLDAEHTVLDWIAAVRAPALLVVGSYLGTLSHTLTATAALKGRACPLLATIVSESEHQTVPAEETAAVLRRFVAGAPVHVVRRAASDPQTSADWAAMAGALPESGRA